MTRETRIGLLVGLMFIIMFGLILSELAGSDGRLPSAAMSGGTSGGDDSAMVEAADYHTPPVPPPLGDREPGVMGAEGAEPVVVGPAMSEPRGVRVSLLADRGQADGSSEAVAGRAARRRRSPPGAGGMLEVVEARRRPSVGSPAGRADHGAGPTPTADAGEAPKNEPRRAPAPATTAANTGKYTVQPRDTLIKIARKVYGPDHQQEYKRIFRANRGRLKSAAEVYPGQVLLIPPLEDRPAAVAAAPAAPAAPGKFQPALAQLADDLGVRRFRDDPNRPADAAGPMAPSHRIYRVRPGDNLTKIAREMLKDPGRSGVRRILKANKGKITNPNLLPVGVELVIPS